MVDNPLILIEHLHYHYQDIPALNDVDLAVPDNAFVAIVGQNGSGKSTLVKHLNGLLKPTSGRVLIDGVDTGTTTVTSLSRTVGFVFQNPDHQIFAATTREELSFGLRNQGLEEALIARRVEETLRVFGLENYVDVPPAVLGFGIRRQISVASVYAMRPRILVLDEPTTGLDWRSATQLMRSMVELHQQGHTILLVTHDMSLVAEYALHTLVMHDGRALALGPTREVLAQFDVLENAGIEAPQVTRLARSLSSVGMPSDVLDVNDFCRAYDQTMGQQA